MNNKERSDKRDKTNTPKGAADSSSPTDCQTADKKGTADLSNPTDCQAADNESTTPSPPPNSGSTPLPEKVKNPKTLYKHGYWRKPAGWKKPGKEGDKCHVDVTRSISAIADYKKCLQTLKIDYRYNELRKWQVTFDDGKTWVDWDRETDSMIAGLVEKHCLLRKTLKTKKGGTALVATNFSAQTRRDAINSLIALHKINPTREYFRSLTPALDKQIECIMMDIFRLDPNNVLSDMGYKPEEITRYAYHWLMSLCVGVIRRTMRPGVVHDLFPILVGAKGCGKSQFGSLLLPPELGAYVPRLSLSLKPCDRLMACQGGSIVEVAELEGLNRREMSDLKAFVSMSDENERLPYAPAHQRIKCHYVPLGTTNDAQFLTKHPDGDRRIPPLLVDRKEEYAIGGKGTKSVFKGVSTILAKNRDKLWAHFLALYKAGCTGLLEDSWDDKTREIRERLIGMSEKRNYALEAALTPTMLGMTDDEVLRGLPMDAPSSYRGRTIMKLVATCYDIKVNYSPQFIANELKQLGWKKARRRVQGAETDRIYIWKPPTSKQPSEPSEQD